MTDPRLERLRSLDTEATPGPWGAQRLTIRHGHEPADVALIVAMRDAWPAVVALVEGVLERHKAIGNLEGGCTGCLRTFWRDCPDVQDAFAVLDSIGVRP